MLGLQNLPALIVSLIVHVVLLGLLAAIRYNLIETAPHVAVETVFSEERQQEEFAQDLQVDTTAAETINVVAGGLQTTNISGEVSSAAAAQTKIEQSETLNDPEFRFNIADLSAPGLDTLGVDLGEGAVSGETGAHVEGYGAAMSRLSQEMLRVMRKQQVIACWLFDESNSLKDDREEIRDQFDKIYTELNIANEEAVKGRFQSLETMIYSFGEGIHPITRRPTPDLAEIRKAIDDVPIDETGSENLFGAISMAIDEHSKAAARSNRKLMIIAMTDEVGDDADLLEEVIAKAQRFKVPIFIMGREAVFGYPYAHVRWINPESGIHHWIRIDRGPETAEPECIQYDGFRGRHDAYSSGFGPYAQVRLVRETGGIFFMLAKDEANLAGRAVHTGLDRKFDDVAMKEYEPLLLERREYVQRRDASDFRRAIWNVIVTVNPHIDRQLNIRWHYYSTELEEFQTEGRTNFDRAVRAMVVINQQLAILDHIRELRAMEAEQRWRAAYDLLYAQLIACRVREFQYLLAMDKHVRENPQPKQPDTNYWDLGYTPEMLEPDEQQTQKTRVDFAELEKQRQQALDLYQHVIEDHPDTPWAMVAADQKQLGFGITFIERFRDPRAFQEEEQGVIPKF
ncbi:MAG: VWA domain-containing protein [Planctomycetaceae bacterium]|nr:VWA domain-containing protein [Planctomycetaceae bacterium]